MESGENQNVDDPAADQAETQDPIESPAAEVGADDSEAESVETQAEGESAAEETTAEAAATEATSTEAGADSTTAEPATAAPQTPILPAPTGEERTWAVLAHMLAIGGAALGWLGWVGPLVIWTKRRHLGPFAAFHALQAIFFQLICVCVLFVTIRMTVVFPDLIYPWYFAGVIPVLFSLLAAIKAHNGEWFEYPLVGRWALELTDQSDA